jgi:ubiquinone/menaquinone biosynthesis C-methylase UbiE
MHDPLGVTDPAVKLTERYDRDASAYRELWAPVLRTGAQSLVRELRGEGVERVLDVATGVGALLPDLADAFPGAFVAGVDRSSGMLGLASSHYGRAIMDARELAIAPASVDRVLMLFMLFHIEEPLAALREAHRVLRSGGRVATLTWGAELESTASRTWAECLDRHGAIPPDPATQRRDEAVNAPEKIEALLRSAGFAQPRAWNDDLVWTFDAEGLIRLKTSLGSSKPRFDSLSPAASAACLADARARMEAISPDGFRARARLVYSTGSRP